MDLGRKLRNHPHFLERSYSFTHRLFKGFDPLIARLGYKRIDRWLRPAEEISKGLIFDCQMCGQCVLHSTGMTCPMTCPKYLRNGPCGGVRSNGHCEVIPEMRCIWVEAFERSSQMPSYGQEMLLLQPPVNQQLQGSSAWINALTGADKNTPDGWEGLHEPTIIKLEDISEWKPSLNQTAA